LCLELAQETEIAEAVMRKETIYKHEALLSAAPGSAPASRMRWPPLRQLLPGLCLIKVNGMNASRERRPLLELALLFVVFAVWRH
jgi:hypothetical protein